MKPIQEGLCGGGIWGGAGGGHLRAVRRRDGRCLRARRRKEGGRLVLSSGAQEMQQVEGKRSGQFGTLA